MLHVHEGARYPIYYLPERFRCLYLKDEAGPGFKLSAGGVIVPAFPNEKRETIPVREFTPKGDKTGRAKQYVDFVTFQQTANQIRILPGDKDDEIFLEVWTGDFDESEGAFQLIQADMFAHGSVAYSGAKVIIDAPSEERTKRDRKEAGVRMSGAAELKYERHGTVVAGIPLWTCRVWLIRFSAKDSDAVLVNQLGTFFLVLVHNGEFTIRPVPAARFQRSYERLVIDELDAKNPTDEAKAAAATVPAVIAEVSAA